MERIGSGERSWIGMRSSYARVAPHEDVRPTVTGPGQIGVAFSGHEQVVYDVGGASSSASFPGGSTVLSGESEIHWSRVREPTEALEIYPEPALLRRVSRGQVSAHDVLAVQPRIGVADPVMTGIAMALRRVHVIGGDLSDMAASTLAQILVRHLLTQYAEMAVPEERFRPTRLDARTMNALHEAIEDGLAGTLTVETLADVAHLSPFHFARAFTATTGLPPHRYVTTRRMDRATALLTSTPQPIHEVAAAVGFRNLSHFRRLFRQHTGGLPSELRANESRHGPVVPRMTASVEGFDRLLDRHDG